MPRLKQYLPIGKNKKFILYHNAYDNYRINSKVLNNNANEIGMNMILWDRENIEKELAMLTGDEEGFCKKGDTFYTAHIPFVKSKLEEIEEKFNEHCKKMVLQGHSKPTEMPVELFNKKLKLEARLSVLEEEKTELEKRLNSYEEKDEKKINEKVLINGPQGNGQLHDGVLYELDGMRVSLTSDGIPYINDPRAEEFYGFLIRDYFTHIVKPWLRAKEERIKQNMEEAKKNNITLDKISRGKLTGRGIPWPVMPYHCVNVKQRKVRVLERNNGK